MFETLWPRLRTWGRLAGFVAGLGVIGSAVLSILATPTAFLGTGEQSAAVVAPELAVIAGTCLALLVVVR